MFKRAKKKEHRHRSKSVPSFSQTCQFESLGHQKPIFENELETEGFRFGVFIFPSLIKKTWLLWYVLLLDLMHTYIFVLSLLVLNKIKTPFNRDLWFPVSYGNSNIFYCEWHHGVGFTGFEKNILLRENLHWVTEVKFVKIFVSSYFKIKIG